MIKPCVMCGTPSRGSRCHEHRVKDTRRARRERGQAAYDEKWRALSTAARRAQPWCSDCGSSSDLTADHVLPKSVVPELVHAAENVAVRCRSCNSRRGTTGVTEADAQQVLDALNATQRRRPSRTTRQRIDAAEAVHEALTRGYDPLEAVASRAAKAQGALHTRGGYA